jgi:hypothetical protein
MTKFEMAAECWRLFYGIRGLQYAKAVLNPSLTTPPEVREYVAGLDVAAEVLADRGAELADKLREALPYEPTPEDEAGAVSE